MIRLYGLNVSSAFAGAARAHSAVADGASDHRMVNAEAPRHRLNAQALDDHESSHLGAHLGRDHLSPVAAKVTRIGRINAIFDVVQTDDLLSRPLFLFFLLNQGSRRVVHIAATRNPTHEWTAQQLRSATMEGLAPRFLIRDHDEKFGSTFDRVAVGAGTRVIKTAVRTPNMNPVGERFVGSRRREALYHVLLLDDQHLENVARQYVRYFNRARPHQGMGKRIPDGPVNDNHAGKVIAIPVLGGLHHDYRRAA
jgi:Integrase core domain